MRDRGSQNGGKAGAAGGYLSCPCFETLTHSGYWTESHGTGRRTCEALTVDVGEVGHYCAAKTIGAVASAGMKQVRMKKNAIARIQLDVNAGIEVDVLYPEEIPVHVLPVGQHVLDERFAVRAGNDAEAAIGRLRSRESC